MNYYTMESRGSLKETVKTTKPIEEFTFKKLLETGIYKHYAYDERIKATRYILRRMHDNYGLPTYLLRCEGNPLVNYCNWKDITVIEVKL